MDANKPGTELTPHRKVRRMSPASDPEHSPFTNATFYVGVDPDVPVRRVFLMLKGEVEGGVGKRRGKRILCEIAHKWTGEDGKEALFV
jgi:hypothetical protein